MRVYPSTRFAVGDDGEVLLEARIELRDEMGDPVKGAGEFRIELFAPNGPLTDTAFRGRQLYLWRVPVYSLNDQKRFYDGITRSYLLRLRLSDPSISQQASILRATFTPLDDSRLEAEATLKPVTP